LTPYAIEMLYQLTYNGTTKPLADWGINEDVVWTELASDVSTMTLACPELEIDAPLLFPYEAAIAVSRIKKDGSSETIFQGVVTKMIRECREGREQHTYIVSDAFWYLKNITYAQQYKILTSFGPPAVYAYKFTECVQLFKQYATDPANTGISNGDTIKDIIAWAIARGAPIQLGTVDLDTEPPGDQQTSISCFEALMRCMAWTPNSTAYLDYTTTPPTFHCVKKATLGTVNKAITELEQPISITPRHDLKMKYVRIAYIANAADPLSNAIAVDIYGLKADGVTETAVESEVLETALPNLRESVDITAASGHQEEVSVLTEDYDMTQASFYAPCLPGASNVEIIPAADSPYIIVYDGSGNIVAQGQTNPADYPRRLVQGGVPRWTGNKVGTAVCTARVRYTKGTGSEQAVTQDVARVDLEVTDCDANFTGYDSEGNPKGHVYRRWVVDDYGEAIPTGVAQALFNALKELQFDGSFTHHDTDCDLTLKVGNKLNITAAATEWATMASRITAVTRRLNRGISQVTIGTASHLSAGDYVALVRHARTRGKTTLLTTRIAG